MRCHPGKTTRAFCLTCRTNGIQIGYVSPMVQMRCPVCGVEWRTISAICERCKHPSGSPYPGDCPKCGGVHHASSSADPKNNEVSTVRPEDPDSESDGSGLWKSVS